MVIESEDPRIFITVGVAARSCGSFTPFCAFLSDRATLGSVSEVSPRVISLGLVTRTSAAAGEIVRSDGNTCPEESCISRAANSGNRAR